MIFKRFFGKTIEAAKKSAKQMYGDNYKVFDSTDEGEEKAGITVVVDKEKGQQHKPGSRRGKKAPESTAEEWVSFKQSDEPKGIDEEQIAPELEMIRQIANDKKKKNQPAKKDDNVFKQVLNNTRDPFSDLDKRTDPDQGKKTTVYGRDAIRSKRQNPGSDEKKQNTKPSLSRSYRPSLTAQTSMRSTSIKSEEITDRKVLRDSSGSSVTKKDSSGNDLLNMFDQSGPKIKKPTVSSETADPGSRYHEREMKALHKRFDKIEALLDSNLILSNIEYISHPAFQQLVKTGISISVVSGWFSRIIKEGIDPEGQSKLFMSKLSEIIKEVLSVDSSAEPLKYQLFTGPSGSGKTELIMKLLLHPEYLEDQKTAVISVIPNPDSQKHYYTILKPFCSDHDISYYEISAGLEVNQYLQEWAQFDTILIDSPSLQIEKEESFRQYWKIRQLLAPLTPLEVHYVVNVSKNRHYFHSSSAIHHPLQPDYIALTHLDEITQWGAVIPFFQDMEASTRYISTGKHIPDSLETFKPAWFAQKLLQDS